MQIDYISGKKDFFPLEFSPEFMATSNLRSSFLLLSDAWPPQGHRCALESSCDVFTHALVTDSQTSVAVILISKIQDNFKVFTNSFTILYLLNKRTLEIQQLYWRSAIFHVLKRDLLTQKGMVVSRFYYKFIVIKIVWY